MTRAPFRSFAVAEAAAQLGTALVVTDESGAKQVYKDALLQPQSRACYAKLLAQGWTDALRTIHPDERIYTFWDYFRRHWETNSGLRIDHLLLNKRLAPRLVDAGVDRWVRGEKGASDHAPTWIVLDAGRSRPRRRTSGA